MRKIILFAFIILTTHLGAVVKVTFPDSFVNGWEPYINQTVEFTHPLYVCGNYYDSLILSTERLYTPEERAIGLAEGDSTAYWRIYQDNRSKMIKLSCRVTNYQVRTGAVIKKLTAKVVAPGKLVTGSSPKFHYNQPEPKPKMPKGGLLICATNIQNYFFDLGGYAQRKTTPQQLELQTLKICKALTHINADIYALCEIQRGDSAPQMLVNAMNKMAKVDRYAFVSDGWDNQDMISCGYIYRKDRVTPYGPMMHAYADTTSHYHYRLIAMGFAEKSSGECFVLNINHLRSKRGTGAESNDKRMLNVDSLLVMLDTIKGQNIYNDPDILLVGDYNSYTYEQPLQTIIQAGYKDVLMQYAPEGYSYVYHSWSGYLDRVFASESMSQQITMIQPYHLNADYYYSRGFKRGLDKTMFRFADHDPILIHIKLGE